MIIAFPPARRASFVRLTAKITMERQGEAAIIFFRRIVRSVERDLKEIGLRDKAEIARLTRDFADAVWLEIRRHQPAPQGEDVA